MRIFGSLRPVLFTRTRMMLIAVYAAATGATGAYAAQIPVFDLVLTENSATGPLSLTLTYNGPSGASAFNVTPISPDLWSIQVDPNSFISLNFTSFDWEEPEDPTHTLINEVSLDLARPQGVFTGQSMTVRSDFPLAQDSNGAVLMNGQPAPLFIGSDDEAGLIQLTFVDAAKTAETGTGVPDTGSTLGLLAFSCGGLLGLSRVRGPRLALARGN